MLTPDKVKKIFTKAKSSDIELFCDLFNNNSADFLIETEAQTNFFLAQVREEVGITLLPKRENLNYSCKALPKIFSWYKHNPREALVDGRCNGHRANQVNIGNRAYANRLGNGDEYSGDGYRFRGGGYFQLTGRSNYSRNAEVISQVLGDLWTPEKLEQEITNIQGGLYSAMAYWLDNKIYNCKDIDSVTRKINRYTQSYRKRKKHYKYIASL